MRFKCTVAYDGTGWNGWQSQPGGNTIQDILEKRLRAVFKKTIRIHGSGRTDAGVHAREQVFHFDADWGHPPADLHRALRSGLPRSILVTSARRAKDTFHARYSAAGKRYRYRIYEGWAPPMENRYCWSLGSRRLDLDAMRAAAQVFMGKHDFRAFGAETEGLTEEDCIKELRRLDVTKRGPRAAVTIEASGFLYKMARSITGALAEAGMGKLAPEDLARFLAGKKRVRQIVTAPARGLTLEKVFY